MKKSRIIIAVILAIVLLITVLNAPTFSWFSRSEHLQKGDEMVLNSNNAYTAYNGGGNSNSTVSFTTEKSSNGVDYSSSNTADLSATTSNPLGVQTRKFFKTTLTNNTGTQQTVSLYAKELSIPTSVSTSINSGGSNGTLAVGVNGPTRNYRDYTALTNRNYSMVQNDKKRIYVQISGYLQNEGWGGATIWANYGCWDGEKTTQVNNHYLYTDPSNGPTYYFDVPYHTDWVYIAVNGWEKSGYQGGQDKTMRSATVTGLTATRESMDQTVLLKVKNAKVSNESNDYRQIENVSSHDVKAAIIKQYYKSITIAKNASFDTRYGQQPGDATAGFSYYHGDSSVTYSSSNTNIFTVNSNGVITGKAAGEAVLTTRVTGNTWGSYGDYVEVKTTVKVTANSTYDFDNVPIVRNVVVPADDVSTDAKENKVDIYWYVINNSASNKLVYTIDEIYVGV